MGTLSSHHSQHTVKLLLVGDSGVGKTASLAGLLNTGEYRMFVQDYDNGLDVLRFLVKPEHHEKLRYATLTDKVSAGKLGLAEASGTPTAYITGQKLLDKWVDPDDGTDFGSVFEWGSDTILVVDSLTLMGEACKRQALYVVNQRRARKQRGKVDRLAPREWGIAIDMQKAVLEELYSNAVKCHVIVTAHLRFIDPSRWDEDEDEDGGVNDAIDAALTSATGGDRVEAAKSSGSATIPAGMYPSALGTSFPSMVGSYFNSMLQVKRLGQRRVIETTANDLLELKSPILKLGQLPQDTGLATFFAKMRQLKKE